jgi:hypothetical protein
MKLKVVKFNFAFFCLFINLIPNSLLAQVIAGEVPLGYTLYESDLMLEAENIIIALDLIDLNFDGEKDLKFQIRKAANGTNSAAIFSELDSIGICHIQGLNYTPAEIYEEGSLLECTDSAGFDLDPALVGISLGRFNGGSVGTFPSQITNEYLHYEWKTEIESIEGWIKISFDLTEDVIFLIVHEWIIKDEITSAQTLEIENKISLFPNPVQDGILYFASEQNIENFEIYNLQGQLLRSGAIFENEIQVGEYRGMVVVKLQTEKGTISEMIFIE